jgi:hypothetical protein
LECEAVHRGHTELLRRAAVSARRPAATDRHVASGASGLSRWIAEHGVVLGLGIVAALPVLAAVIRAVTASWFPMGDNAFTAVNALDVLSRHPPLVGQWSSGATAVVHEPVYSPGPMLFWLLAVPVRLPEPSLQIATVGLMNVACVIGVVVLARRRGGSVLATAVALGIPLMLASLPGEAHADMWNSSVGLLPLLLLIFLAWSVACGDHRLLPVTVLAASFIAQAHLTFVAPAVAALAVGLVGLTAASTDLLRGRLTAVQRRQRRSLVRSATAAVLVGAICWSAPVVEQVREQPGNLTLLVRAATADVPAAGAETGWHAVVRTVGVVPWWLTAPQAPDERAAGLRAAPGALATATAVLVLSLLVVGVVAGWRRRRTDAVAACALALALCASMMQVAASTPAASFDNLGYTLRWASPMGLWVWVATGWSLVVLAPRGRWASRRRPTAAGAALALVSVAAVASIVAVRAHSRPDPFREMRDVADRLDAQVPRDDVTRVDALLNARVLFQAFQFEAGTVYALRRRGSSVVAPSIALGLGERYAGQNADRVARIEVDEPAPGPGRMIARVAARDPLVHGQPTRSVAVRLLSGAR